MHFHILVLVIFVIYETEIKPKLNECNRDVIVNINGKFKIKVISLKVYATER